MSALPTAFIVFIVALPTSALIAMITKLRQLACRDDYQNTKLDICENELSSRGAGSPYIPMIFNSNHGGAPSGQDDL